MKKYFHQSYGGFKLLFLSDLFVACIEKASFVGQYFPKSSHKTLFVDCFFFLNFLRLRKFGRKKVMIWKSSENHFGRLRNKGQDFRVLFENLPLPRKNPRSAPD